MASYDNLIIFEAKLKEIKRGILTKNISEYGIQIDIYRFSGFTFNILFTSFIGNRGGNKTVQSR